MPLRSIASRHSSEPRLSVAVSPVCTWNTKSCCEPSGSVCQIATLPSPIPVKVYSGVPPASCGITNVCALKPPSSEPGSYSASLTPSSTVPSGCTPIVPPS